MTDGSGIFAPLTRDHALDADMRGHHDVRVLVDAHEAWTLLQADLDAAQVSILVELYMLVADAVGQEFAAKLAAAVGRGVDVRVTLDGFGSLDLAGPLLTTLTTAGVHLRMFHPVSSSTPWRHWRKRNHRKVIVIDERVAHIGGRNMGASYYAVAADSAVWLDLGARVEGPCVAQMAAVLRAGLRKVARPTVLPALGAGDALVTAAFHLGVARKAFAHKRLLAAVRQARTSIRLVQAYFLPDWAMQRALVSATRRGVDVRIIVPDLTASDVPWVALASEHGVGRLLRRGVRVLMLRSGKLHAKFAIVDGIWWTLGSTNLDPLSRLRNLEANLVGLGATEAAVMSAYCDEIAALAEEVSWEQWRQRPLWRRIAGAVLWRLRGLG